MMNVQAISLIVFIYTLQKFIDWRMKNCGPHQMSIMLRPGLIQLFTYCRTCRCASAACRKSFHMSSLASSRTRFSSLLIRHAALLLDNQTIITYTQTHTYIPQFQGEKQWDLLKVKMSQSIQSGGFRQQNGGQDSICIRTTLNSTRACEWPLYQVPQQYKTG